MDPYGKERFELDNGKVLSEEMRVQLLLQPLGLTLLTKYHDFLRETPWARCDN